MLPWAPGFPASSPPSPPPSHVQRLARKARGSELLMRCAPWLEGGGSAWTPPWVTRAQIQRGVLALVCHPFASCVCSNPHHHSLWKVLLLPLFNKKKLTHQIIKILAEHHVIPNLNFYFEWSVISLIIEKKMTIDKIKSHINFIS